MIQEHILGEIQDVREDGTAVITAGLPDLDRALLRQYKRVEIILPDGRRISPEQRRKVYAILGEISEYVSGCHDGDALEETKATMKMDFMLKRMESMERRLFSLSDCSVTTARAFIDYLVSFVIANDIPTKVPLIEQCEDVSKYMYACVYHRKCAVCGRAADIHHCEGSRIGAGVDRAKAHQLGREVLPLCRVHHTECHAMPEGDFVAKYHLQTVRLDEALCKRLKLRK